MGGISVALMVCFFLTRLILLVLLTKMFKGIHKISAIKSMAVKMKESKQQIRSFHIFRLKWLKSWVKHLCNIIQNICLTVESFLSLITFSACWLPQ